MSLTSILTSRAGAAVTAGIGLAMLSSGSALAMWTTSGTGTGSAAAATSLALTTTAVTPAGTLLHPGGSGDLRITISNPNPFAVTVTSVAAGAGSITSDKVGCSGATTGVSLATQNGSWVVPAKVGAVNGTATVLLANALSMSNASDTTCQGAVFTVPVALTGASS